MKQKIIDSIKEDWRIQTCQFEYWSHLKWNFVLWHLVLFIGSLLSCFLSRFCGLASIPCMISWDYFVLIDKKRLIYKDEYRPQKYEIIGTIWATLVTTIVIVGLIVSWSGEGGVCPIL